MDVATSRESLIRILQFAYSGERAAAYAYNGHWKSVSVREEQEHIRQIEDEEWHHRRLVGEMLAKLGAGPNRWRELRASIVGRTLGFACHITPWFIPMYGAGRLESRNVREYESAAAYARGCGRHEFVDCLVKMAEVEWEHEVYFRSKVEGHAWAKFIPLWPSPAQPSRATDGAGGSAPGAPASVGEPGTHAALLACDRPV